jgi:Flp pilus assembly pilin Flp
MLFKRGDCPSTERIPEMKRVLAFISHFIGSQEGTTAIEYALVASLIFLAIVLAVTELGGAVANMYRLIATCFQ